MTALDPRLQARADAGGVQTAYIDAFGEQATSTPAAVEAVLELLGSDRAAADAVVVAWDGACPELLPGTTVVLEDGSVAPDGRLPFGYHTLRRGDVEVGTLISAPMRGPRSMGHRWGAFLPLYALRTARTQGLASYPELDGVFEWLSRYDGQILLTLPLLPLHLDDPVEWSPYAPSTRRLWGEHFVDLTPWRVADDPPPPVPRDGLLDYAAIAAWRTPILDRAAAQLADAAPLRDWLARTPLAARYARFRATQARHGRQSVRWPADASPDPIVERRHLVGCWLADTQLGRVAAAARRRGQSLALDVALGAHPDGFDVWAEGELFVHGVGVGAPPDTLFLGGQDWGFPPVHPERSRASGHRYLRDTIRHHLRHAGLLRLDHVMGLARQWWVPAGAPATDGAYVRYPLEEMMAVVSLEAHLAGAVVVGENLGTVPPEVDASLRRHAMLGICVGQEALADVTLERRVGGGPTVMTMLSTHDSVPFAAFWHGGDHDRALRLGLIDAAEHARSTEQRAELRRQVIAAGVARGVLADTTPSDTEVLAMVTGDLAADDTPILVVPIEDLWLEQRGQNAPGTTVEEPNWRGVGRMTLEEWAADRRVHEVVTALAANRSAADPSASAG